MIVYEVNTAEIFDAISRLIVLTKEELAKADEKTKYISGEKDEEISERILPLLEDVTFGLYQSYSRANTLGDNTDLEWKRVYFYSDMYYELVTLSITLAALRKNDITDSIPFKELLDEIALQMETLSKIDSLKRLRDEIAGLKEGFPEKPLLKKKVKALVKQEQNIFIVEPPKSTDDYSNGEVLARIIDGISITEAELCSLPDGVTLDSATGEVKVADPAALIPGVYTFSVLTTDDGLQSPRTLTLQIGESPSFEYNVSAAKQVSSYTDGELLASVSIPGAAISSVELVQGTLPPGTSLNSATGNINVTDAQSLRAGTYNLLLRITDEFDRAIEKVASLEFLADPVASVVLFPVKEMSEYEAGSVLAILEDPSGNVVNIQATGLPAGVSLDAQTGNVFVSDSAALVPGTYPVRICVTAADGTETSSLVTLQFGPASDTPAVYTIAGAKALNQYTEGEIIASVIDPDGPVTQADFLNGQLPPGTGLHRFNGSVIVRDVRKLVPGKFEATVSTTDVRGGISKHTLSIVMGTGVVYQVARAKNVDSYETNNVLATAFVPGNEIVNATVSSGSLPPGTSIESNGTIKVSDAAQLAAGSYTFSVTVTTASGTNSTETITLEFLPDTEAVYTYSPQKNRDSYKKGDILATAADPDGKIIKATVIRGSLPQGVVLETDTGTLKVDNPDLLKSGTFTGTIIRTEDIWGGKTDHSITLVIKEDKEAVYTVLPAKPVNLYNNGDILARAYDEDGEIFSASLTDGTLPPGTGLNTGTGEITVTDKAKMKSGTYTPVIETADATGGRSKNTVTIEILPRIDIEASYVIAPPRNVDSYKTGDMLGVPNDPDGDITSAILVTGALPPGTSLNSVTGAITVANPELLVPGTYVATIVTTDVLGGTSTIDVQITISPDNEAVYTISPTKKYTLYQTGEVIATVTDKDGLIVSASLVSGSLPPGVALDTANGNIYVQDASLLAAGTSSFRVETIDSTGGRTQHDLSITIADDSEAVYTVEPAKNIHSLRLYDKLATVTDLDGAIVSAPLTSGSLPPGTSLHSGETAPVTDTGDLPAVTINVGDIYVSNRSALVAGSYTIGILTTDASSGTTAHTITIVIRASGPPVRKEFIRDVGPRMVEIRERHKQILQPADVVNTTVMNLSEILFDKISSGYKDSTIEEQYRSGQKDVQVRSDMTSATTPVKEGIVVRKADIANTTGETQERLKKDLAFFLDLYNEQIITIIELIGHRHTDLSPTPNHDINVLIDTLKSQMQALKNIPEAAFIRENVSALADDYAGKTRLTQKINEMLA